MIYLVFAIALLTFLENIDNWLVSYSLYALSNLIIVLTQRQHTAVIHMALGFFIIKSLELIAFQFIPVSAPGSEPSVWVNHTIYFTHFITDCVFLAFILFRPPISRVYLRKLRFVPTRMRDLTYTRAEALLLTVTAIYIFVDLLAIVENFMRNLEHLGVASSVAANFWQWTLVYHTYPTIKQILNVLEFLLIFATLKRLSKENPKFLA